MHSKKIPTCVFLHSSMSSGQQWQALRDSLEHPSVAPDLSGYGKAAMPNHDREQYQLSHEIESLAPVLPGQPFHLVGHSYGAATALRIARTEPERILSLTLFEPVAFYLLPVSDPQRVAITGLSETIRHHLAEQRADRAAASFIDYWNGDGTFSRLNDKMQTLFCKGILKVAYDFAALLNESCPPAALSSIKAPVLLLEGSESPPTVHAVMHQLQQAFPAAEHHSLPCSHMGPVTHPELVNPLIRAFLNHHSGIRIQL